MTLDKLEIGKKAVIRCVNYEEKALYKHILDMGLTPGTEITLVKTAPMGDPIELQVRGYSLTIRKEDAANIQVERIHTASPSYGNRKNISDWETGKVYRPRVSGTSVPEGAELSFALVGNQNCGKTTLFNQLTGSNQRVGNFPGVTVDRKDGTIRNHPEATVTDLPGIYSLSPYTSEEIVTRNLILREKPSGIINIIDATNIERNLYLTLQLIELDVPTVVAFNMMDEVMENGGSMDIKGIEGMLGVPVVPISAMKNTGIEELIDRAVNTAKTGARPGRKDFCRGVVGGYILKIEDVLRVKASGANIPLRFAATKIIEGDELMEEALRLDSDERGKIKELVSRMEKETGQDAVAAMADMRFSFIEELCRKFVKKPTRSRQRIRSEKADRILTGKYTAIPAFIAVMGLVFYLTFSVIGAFLSDLMESAIDSFTIMTESALISWGVNAILRSLVIDGIMAGIGSILSFLPTILVLFCFLSILEDSGYMARVAFIMDRPLRKVGLSGKSFVPMLMGFGCSVPAIMATRTLPSDRDRKMTIMLVPFMSCSAKLPIYMLFVSLFFPEKSGLIIVGLYLIGILISILFAAFLDKSAFGGQPVPFVLELPNYRFPTFSNVTRLMWDKAKDFITRAFTVILLSSVVIWFLQTFDTNLRVVSDSSESLLALLGGVIAHIFKPLQLGDWRISTALITGFMAKESVVSTLTVLFGGDTAAISGIFTPFTAFVFLVFSLLYTPCVAAIAAVRRELGGKWAAGIIVLQCTIAWVVSFVIFTIGIVLGLV